MAQNVEIKARANDFALQFQIAEKMSETKPEALNQSDTFFKVNQGRLKLREFDNQNSQLIFYQRNNSSGPKVSEYQISEIADPESLKLVLDKAYGIGSIVVKSRRVFIQGRTRIHFDQVRELGDFIELEVVLSEGDSLSEAELEAQKLMALLQIEEQDLVSEAYVDLLSTDQTSELDETVVRQLVYR